MDNIVFVVGTEYQLIVSLGIINEYYSEGYKIYIYRISNVDRRRLNHISFEDSLINYRELIYDYEKPTFQLKVRLQEFLDLHPQKFFFFFENKFWLNYLLSRLHKQGTSIVLAPDGMKTYDNKSYWSTKQRLFMLYEAIKHTIKTRLYTWPLVEKTYATSKYIDEVWVEHPEFYNNITNKKVVEFHYSINQQFIYTLKKVFQVQEVDFETISNKPTILFLDSSYHTKEYYERTIGIMLNLQERFPGRKILIKYHPLSAKEARVAYSGVESVQEVNFSYPAELYIASAYDAIVVSMVSTSELFYNPKCVYYWIYKLYSDICSYNYDTLKNPTNYIQVVNSITQIGAKDVL